LLGGVALEADTDLQAGSSAFRSKANMLNGGLFLWGGPQAAEDFAGESYAK